MDLANPKNQVDVFLPKSQQQFKILILTGSTPMDSKSALLIAG